MIDIWFKYVTLHFRYFGIKNVRNGMHKFHWLPQKAFCRIGGTRYISFWFLNMYFSVSHIWMPWWNFKINTRMDDPGLDSPHIMLNLATWQTSPQGMHRCCLTFRSGASVWVIFPTWLSWQNHWYYIKLWLKR